MDLLWTTLSEFPGEGCVGSGVGARKPENVAAVQCHLLYFILFFLLLAKLMRFLWLKESNYYEAFLLESQVVPHSWCHIPGATWKQIPFPLELGIVLSALSYTLSRMVKGLRCHST